MGMGPGATLRPIHIFWVAILILAAVSTTAVISINRLLDQYSASTRSQEVVLQLHELLSDLKDVESSARGYALTRDPDFLGPYRIGTANLQQRLPDLRRLAHGNELGRRLDELIRVANRRVEVANDLIQLASTGASRGELVKVASTGMQIMDDVRGHVAAVIAVEENLRLRRMAMLEREALRTSIALAAGVAVSLVVLAALFSQLNREVRRRREIEDELRELNAELEQRVQDRTAQVQQTRDLLDAVVENMPDAIVLKEPLGDGFRYLLVNKASEKLFGRDRKQILGKTERDIFPPDEAAKTVEANKAVTDSGKARTFTDRNLTTTTGVRKVETRMVPIARNDGLPSLVLGIIRDVTEQKALESQVREMQRLDSVGRLTGGIAHDFNNLLAVIMGSIEMVCEQVPKDSETAEIAGEALAAVRRGAELVRRLLAFARKQHLEPTAVNLNDRLPGIVPLLQRSLGEKIKVQVQSADELWHARIDATQVDDALVNLAINARDAMPSGGTLTIETTNVVLDEDYADHHVDVVPGEYVMLAVSDTGVGMPPEVAARAFEPFYTTKGEGEGTGLGLSQIFGWVKQSGGHIKIYSELDHGTTVKLYLPRARDEDMAAQVATPEDGGGGGDETILLVEDNPHVRRTAMRQLADLGFSIIEAQDAESALEKVRSGTDFDLLFTDVVMPGGMSGYELAAEVEKLRPGTKVLFTSGYTELAAKNGVHTVRKGPLISKPYRKYDLGRAIRSVLDQAKGA